MAIKIKHEQFDMLGDLTKQQQAAIRCDNRRVLVLAGAGSGKTRTLLQKIVYLIREKKVKSDEIMAITFTKNATHEMIDRLLLASDNTREYAQAIRSKHVTMKQANELRRAKMREHKWIARLTLRTFHGLCYKLMRNYGAKEFDNRFRIVTSTGNQSEDSGLIMADESQYEILHKMLIKCSENRDWLLMFKRFILDYMVDRLHLDQKNFILDHPEGKYFTSLRGEKVRSKSEQYICDWLYRHNIDYIYEPKVQFTDIKFRPDFFVPAANIYIEHVSGLSASMIGKEKQFGLGGRTMVRTFEGMTRDSNLFNLALTRIIKSRLPEQYDIGTALKYEEEMKGRHREIRDFLRQVTRVLEICQTDEVSIERLKKKLSTEPYERVRLFYQCCLPIIAHYQAYCIEKSYLDFNQLIDRCIKLIRRHPDIQKKLHQQYKYVLVDEFQDVNKKQIELLKAMMNPEAQLFCVGDDWQSIYGFRGSDVRFIVDFSKYFKESMVFHLNTNFRSTDKIVKASNEVIANNRYKVDKEIKASTKSKRKIEVYAGTDLPDNMAYVTSEIKTLLESGINGDDILFLYRRSKMFDPYRQVLKENKIRVNAKTIHGAKGLKAQVVFIIGLTTGFGGFPDVWMGDRVYQLVRPTKYDILMEEERRLFYVAITRAKERLYLITELGAESSFISEIPENYKVQYSPSINLDMKYTVNCESCGVRLEKYFKYCPNCGIET